MVISRSNIGFELKNKEGNKPMAKKTMKELRKEYDNREAMLLAGQKVAEKNKGQKSTVGPIKQVKKPAQKPVKFSEIPLKAFFRKDAADKFYKKLGTSTAEMSRLNKLANPVTKTTKAKTPDIAKKPKTYQERRGSTVGTAGQTRAKKRKAYGDIDVKTAKDTPKRETGDRFARSSEKTQDKSSKKIKDKPAKGKPPKPSVKPAAPSVADKKKIYSKVGANIKQHRGGKSTMGGRTDKVDSPLPKHLKAPLKTPAGKGLSSVGSKTQRRKPVTSATGFGEQMDLQRLKEVKRSKHREKDYPYLGERKKLTSNRNPFGGGMKDGGEVEAYFREQTIPWEEKQKRKGKK